MTCSCGFENLMGATACARCGWTFIPAGVSVLPRCSPGRRSAVPRVNRSFQLWPTGDASFAVCAAALVPGLGHAMIRMPWSALLTFMVQATLLAGVIHYAGTSPGNVLLFLCLVHHGHSMFLLVRQRFHAWSKKAALRAAILIYLAPLGAVYIPTYLLWNTRYDIQKVVWQRPPPPLMKGDVIIIDRRAAPLGEERGVFFGGKVVRIWQPVSRRGVID